MFAYLYSKPLGNHSLKIMKKYLEIYFKNLEKSWKYHGILSVRKSGNPEIARCTWVLVLTELIKTTPGVFHFCLKFIYISGSDSESDVAPDGFIEKAIKCLH